MPDPVTNKQKGWTRSRMGLAGKRVLAIGGFAACLAILGCGGGDNGSAAGGGDIELISETPAPAAGDIDLVSWALTEGEPSSLDYAQAGSFSPDIVVSTLCDNLLRMNADFTLAPGIAESWDQVDPTTLVYKIRSGVKYWNGKTLTAADVVYNLKRSQDPETGLVYSTFYENVKSIKETDDLEVTVKFTKPDELFNEEMATAAGGIAEPASMEKNGRKFGTPQTGVMCTGPFELGSWTPGDSITITRNDSYWDPDLQPNVKKLKFNFIDDGNTLTSALLAGEIDGAFNVPISSIPALQSADNGSLYYGKSFMALNAYPLKSDGPVANKKIRQAMKLIVDREAIASKVLNGAALPSRTLVPRAIWDSSYPPEATKLFEEAYEKLPAMDTPDMDAAKKLVDESGEKGAKIVFAVQAGNPESSQIATLLQASAKQIGLNIQIQKMNATQHANLDYSAATRKQSGADMVLEYDFFDIADPIDLLPYRAVTGGFFNFLEYSNPKVDKAIAAARSNLDRTESARQIVKAQEIYTEDAISLPIASPYNVSFLNEGITGTPVSFSVLFAPWAAHLGNAK